jgi:hypothetical protein
MEVREVSQVDAGFKVREMFVLLSSPAPATAAPAGFLGEVPPCWGANASGAEGPAEASGGWGSSCDDVLQVVQSGRSIVSQLVSFSAEVANDPMIIEASQPMGYQQRVSVASPGGRDSQLSHDPIAELVLGDVINMPMPDPGTRPTTGERACGNGIFGCSKRLPRSSP